MREVAYKSPTPLWVSWGCVLCRQADKFWIGSQSIRTSCGGANWIWILRVKISEQLHRAIQCELFQFFLYVFRCQEFCCQIWWTAQHYPCTTTTPTPQILHRLPPLISATSWSLAERDLLTPLCIHLKGVGWAQGSGQVTLVLPPHWGKKRFSFLLRARVWSDFKYNPWAKVRCWSMWTEEFIYFCSSSLLSEKDNSWRRRWKYE